MAFAIQTGVRYCGAHYYNATDTDWNLIGNSGVRSWSKTIAFPSAFLTAPYMQVFLSGFNMLSGHGQKINLTISNVTTTNFRLTIDTYDDAQVAGVTVGWVAITV